jgi:hypothetical protein
MSSTDVDHIRITLAAEEDLAPVLVVVVRGLGVRAGIEGPRLESALQQVARAFADLAAKGDDDAPVEVQIEAAPRRVWLGLRRGKDRAHAVDISR